MEYCPLGCQVCLTNFQRVFKMKQHIYSQEHRQKLADVFKSDVFSCNGFFPYVILIDAKTKQDCYPPVIGLSLLTLCFNKESQSYFYLCHVCEEKCSPNTILRHISHGDHYSNYFIYTDPNMLSYSWIPSMDMGVVLRPQLTQEIKESGRGTLQMLDLPEKLMTKLKASTYSEVMATLRENCELNKLLEAVKPKRTMIQTYQRDSNRKHPLLGIQHVVECICDGMTEKRYYLCTLCKLTLATHMIIKHILSFDHIFCYFKEWHPSTLLSKECYTDYEDFASNILDISKQTEEIHGTANTEMKQVILDPVDFASVNFACYAEALKKLESKMKGSSLIISIKPGDKLEFRVACTKVSTLSNSVAVRCQDCCLTFATLGPYLGHLSKWKHKQMLMKWFVQAERDEGYKNTGWKPYLGLYRYLQDSLKKNQPVIGVSLIVTCISTDVKEENIYMCFACEESFCESVLREHFESKSHIINTLLYLNPWRLPFAWENQLEVKDLKSLALEEEKDRRQNQVMMMKVFDIPCTIFWSLLPPTYEKVMMTLQLYHTIIKDAVPQRETYRKLQQNERFPLLGKQFMVMYNVRNDNYSRDAFLCLLCERMLSDDEFCAHVFSMEHVKAFLDRFHPGSLMPGIDPETILDLAKQAAYIHSISNVQVIKLEWPIWEPCSYRRAISILGSAKRRSKQVALEPPITPRMKLVPREIVKGMAKEHMKDSQKNSTNQSANGSIQEKTSQKSIDDSDAILKTNALEVKPEILKCSIKSDKHGEEESKNETLTPSEDESEKRKETTSEEMEMDTSGDRYQLKKEENAEESIKRKPNGDKTESCQDTDKDDRAEAGKERVKSSKVYTSYMCKENEKCMSEKSKKDMCPDKNVWKQLGLQQLISKDDASCEEPQNMPSSRLKHVAIADKESSKPCHEVEKDKAPPQMNHLSEDQLRQYIRKKSREPVIGLSDLYECLCDQHDTIYLCQCCSLMVTERDIINHVTGFHHWKMYLMGLQSLPPQQQMEEIRHLAETCESLHGYGEVQVVKLDEDSYNKISKQDFKSALQTVKSFQTLNQSIDKLPSALSQSDVEPVDTSESLQIQHKEQYMTGKIQMVEMEIDTDSEDQLRHSLHVNVSSSKDDVTQSANKEPLKVANASKILGTSQSSTPSSGTGATVKLTAAKHNSCATVTSTAPTSSCAIATTKCKETIDKCTATTCSSTPAKSSCNTITTKLGDTDYKSTATTFSAAAPTSKLTVDKLNCTITTKSIGPTSSCTASAESTVSLPTVATIAAPKVAKKCENKGISANNSNADFSSHIDVSNHPPAMPHWMTAMSDRSENKNPHTEPSHTSITKTKPNENPPKIGINHLIIVSCEGRQQVYCELCSVRLKNSSHAYGNTHRLNYVKMKYPEWNAEPSELQNKLDNIVTLLAEVEKDVTPRRSQSIQVKHDVYKELAALPEDKALEKLKKMREHRALWETRSPTTDCPEALRQTSFVSSISPFEISSPDDEISLPQSEVSGFSANRQREHESNQEVQKCMNKDSTANGLNQSQLSHLSFSKYNPEPTPPCSIQEPNTAVTDAQVLNDPAYQTGLQVLPRISVGVGTKGCSKLSRFLNILTLDTKPIIGMGSVWECQGISRFTFYLCEHCREMLSVNDICRHMVSRAHQINSMMADYPKFLYFLAMDNVPKEEKLSILMDIAPMFSAQERFKKIDAQVVMLTHELYERVWTAPFSKALEMVQNIKGQKMRVLCQPVCNSHRKDKRCENQQNRNEFHQTPMQLAQEQTAYQHENDSRPKPEKHCLAETRSFDKVTKRKKILGPVHVDSVFSKDDPTETHRNFFMQPEIRQRVSDHQRLIPEQQQGEVHSESPSFSSVDLETAQTLSVSPRDVYIQSRKRPALPSFQTYYTTDPQLKHPQQVKCARSSLQAVSQCSPESALKSASVNPALISTLLSPEGKGTGPGFNRGDIDPF